MNVHGKRFNRTIVDECNDCHYDLIFLDDPTDFDLELVRWLALALACTIPSANPPVQYVLARYSSEYHIAIREAEHDVPSHEIELQ